MTMPMLQLAMSEPDDDVRLLQVAEHLAEVLARGEAVSRRRLARAMTCRFGGSDAEGRWTMRQAYDALEAAQILLLRRGHFDAAQDGTPAGMLADLLRFEQALPTQSYRSERQVDYQQFSTPLGLAWLAARAAHIRPSDLVLEPSAGTGMLAVHAAIAGARLYLNERDPDRAALLQRALDTAVSGVDAEHIDNLLDTGIEPTVILVNPPFGRSEARGRDRHAGARHLRSALVRLADHGRCVALMPPSFASRGSGATGYATVCEVVPPRVEITISGRSFAKHGTSIDLRLLVFDKGWVDPTVRLHADRLADALPFVEALPARLSAVPRAPATATAPKMQARSAPHVGLFGVRARARLAPPVGSEPVEAALPVRYHVRAEPRAADPPAGLYVPWRLARIDIEGARRHPDQLVESIAMASVLPPAPRYIPLLHPKTVAALSNAQLEAVIQAGDAFERDLPGLFKPNLAGDQLIETADGRPYRTGFFIGDGTGVGKGREAAACIRDQWNRGRRKAIWISKSSALIEDARRDWVALGGLALDIQPLDAFPVTAPITMSNGIMFLTYAGLRSARHDAVSRLQQILAFADTDFDGLVIFDEAHAMANAAGTENDYGVAKGSEQGLAGVRLQNALPRARILYVSATGATDPANLCYAARLGLWGSGSAFRDREAFLTSMEEGGIAAMEIVARDLKAMGLYTARALSFAGVEYDPIVHRLTADQIAIYDAYAEAWAIIHRHLDAALKAANIVDRISGATMNAQARGAALSRFESAKQRFFGQILLSMKMPTLIPTIEQEVAAGHAVVIQLVTTAASVLGRRLADLTPTERAELDIDLSPREYMIDYLRHAFPTRMMQVFKASDGTMRSEMMLGEDGAPILCQEAVQSREALIERLCAMPPVPAALDALVWHFGTDVIAEITGRSRRIILDDQGRQKLERRSGRANLVEADAFMDGRKHILAFSDAGGTGRSYHADLAGKSAGRRRVHILLEPGWKAATAIQGLGRSHRTNQSSPPIFRPVTTDCKGERRFISTIARRLDSLGALTRGQRQTGGQNLFDPADNLESDHAREALGAWYKLLHAGKLASTSLAAFEMRTGLVLTSPGSGDLLERLPPIQRWLNRLLALPIGIQNAIFDEYAGLVDARIDAAREAGTLDLGVETIATERFVISSQHILRTDPLSGAETRLLRLALHRRPASMSWRRLITLWSDVGERVFLRNLRSGKVAMRVPSWAVTDDDGRPVPMCQLIRPTGRDRMSLSALAMSSWARTDEADCRAGWDAEVAEAARKLDVETICIATGLLLPVWHRLPSDDVRVRRITDRQGEVILGRVVSPAALVRLGAAFGLDDAIMLSPADIVAAARADGGAPLGDIAGATLRSVFVNDGRRLEIRGFAPADLDRFKQLGCFTEIIAYRTRLFIPVDRAEQIVAKIVAAFA